MILFDCPTHGRLQEREVRPATTYRRVPTCGTCHEPVLLRFKWTPTRPKAARARERQNVSRSPGEDVSRRVDAVAYL